jgi:hypothetical protein
MDIVLGVSMAPTMVRIVLVEGENADGVTVEEGNFDVVAADDAATSGAPQQVIAAILGTREGAVDGGYRLVSTGVTWTEPTEIDKRRFDRRPVPTAGALRWARRRGSHRVGGDGL